MSLHPHLTKPVLERLIPVARVSGGSFAESLPHPKKLTPRERRSMYVKGRKEAITETVADLLCSVDSQTRPPLERGSGGQRVWPNGYTGNLTHKGAVVLGALVQERKVRSIGVDLELYENERSGLDHTVRDAETPPNADAKISTLAGFSVKEAAYKAYFRLDQRIIDFDEIRLTWRDSLEGIARGWAEFPNSVELEVQCAFEDDWILSTALCRSNSRYPDHR